ncbi:MAG: DNA-directed RNA polymerase subunit alpha [Candidatus Ryanbacteria bacterium CG10_big_fil_rev_8_21_14_0_10_43_42]|uniref:DNA-directed RNA polymerase subunit alpha n=1 Tax=Candidatus Ryanbacteria bacterium CG10_big_fil_rev_8_21_14_0_10_43_42 TaxID=1974864 RepID=A0A2M8KX61_9BACT|nr:MAG: DNA-directed RNA polymerase subunit alpha [Candidatus Ryanbacteria bacterium CG10_big_fil_rev_8_21_14_0_10_43_42]
MKHDIILPSKPKTISEEGNAGIFEIDGFYPGYGITVGNVIRRILLSSLPGAAITQVKIDGVQHEFSTIDGVQEDVITILLNLKKLRFIMQGDESQTVEVSIKGVKTLTGKDIKTPSTIEIINPDAHIMTVTDKNTSITMEFTVEKGLGYATRASLHKDKVDVGMMTLDALFSPIQKATHEVEDMRVGDRTDYNRLRLHIETDGTITPREALMRAIAIALEQFTALAGAISDTPVEESTPAELSLIAGELSTIEDTDSDDDGVDVNKVKIEDLHLPSRTINALHENGIRTIGGLLRKDTETLSEIPGIGDKAIQEIRRAIGSMGLTLK